MHSILFYRWTMKKRYLLIVLSITIFFLICSCTEREQAETLPQDTETELKEFDITFNTNGGSSIPSQKVKEWSKVELPEDPVKDKYIFLGWYLDESFGKEFSPLMLVHENLILYAKWGSNTQIDVEDGYHDNIEWNGSIIT